MNKKKLSTIISFLMISAMFAGCGKTDVTSDTNDMISSTSSAANETSDEEITAGEEISENETAGEFPITVKHALGTVVIKEKPERVATIAWCNHDVALALGVAPVGVSRMNFAVDETGIFPWAWDKFHELGVDDPVVFDDVDGWDYEAIADVQPDVILAGYSGITEEEYERLSEIAPVIAYPNGPWVSTWREQTLINAEGLGKKSEAEQLIKDTEKLISDKLTQYPDVVDKTVAFCWFSADDLRTFYIYTNNDPRASYLGDLGMVMPESVKEAIDDPTAFSITVSAENADKFNDVDMIITYGDDELLKAMQSDPRISAIPAIANGAVVLLDSNDCVAASSTPSILSIPYIIDDYLNMLDAAAKKVK